MPEIFEQTHVEPRPLKKIKRFPQKIISKLLFIGVVVAMAVFAYLYTDAKRELQMISTTQGQTALAQKEVKDVTDKLGKLTIIPNEEPVVATILDSKMLATKSAFYTNAENGDKLVVYSSAQKAYIYSPIKNVIVNAGPLSVDQNQTDRPVRFELRNGAKDDQLLSKIKAQLDDQQQLISAVTEASRKDYAQIFVIPINSAIKPDQLTDFAKGLNAKVNCADAIWRGQFCS